MATLELHRGLEPGTCVWGGERADLPDNFDSEMQEWEDQLQDMQKKIEELYNEVKARREASESSTNKSLDITLLPVNSQYNQQANGYHEPHELTCEGEAVRDYLYRQMAHKICTSTSRVQRLECRHSCSSGLCCAPTKSRRRKLSFKCPDGSSFSEEMEITVECGCTKCSS